MSPPVASASSRMRSNRICCTEVPIWWRIHQGRRAGHVPAAPPGVSGRFGLRPPLATMWAAAQPIPLRLGAPELQPCRYTARYRKCYATCNSSRKTIM
jgi:hypothetical protein